MLRNLKRSIPNKRAEELVWVVEIVRKEPGRREFFFSKAILVV